MVFLAESKNTILIYILLTILLDYQSVFVDGSRTWASDGVKVYIRGCVIFHRWLASIVTPPLPLSKGES